MAGRGRRGGWMGRGRVRPHVACLVALLLALALAGCGADPGAAATPSGAAPPILALPPQLAGAHVYVADVATGDLALLGARTLHVARSVHGLGLSSDRRWLYVS